MDKILQKIETRKKELRSDLENLDKEVNLEEVQEELRNLELKEVEVRKRLEVEQELKGFKEGTREFRSLDTSKTEDDKMENKKEKQLEKRAKELLENRSVFLDDIEVKEELSTTINPTFTKANMTSKLVSLVKLNGGESFVQPFVTSDMLGEYTQEGEQSKETNAGFGSVHITKNKITTYQEISEEVERLAKNGNVNPYLDTIEDSILTGLYRKLNAEILIGDGSNQLQGIFTATKALSGKYDIEIENIDEHTLDDIVFLYGVEDMEDEGTLILSRKSLREFARLRKGDNSKVYSIEVKGSVGTIDGIPFVINNAADYHDEFFMAYGNLKNYQLVLFDDVETIRSADYKFREGLVAYRGSVFAGGDVVVYEGFVRVKKKQGE